MTLDDSSLTAIFAETGPRLRAQSAAITLRIWHHLDSEDARLLLFEPFRADGRPYPLLDAILIAAADARVSFALQLDAPQVRSGQEALGEAFASALADMLGAHSRDHIIPAWRHLLDRMLDRIVDRIERRRA